MEGYVHFNSALPLVIATMIGTFAFSMYLVTIFRVYSYAKGKNIPGKGGRKGATGSPGKKLEKKMATVHLHKHETDCWETLLDTGLDDLLIPALEPEQRANVTTTMDRRVPDNAPATTPPKVSVPNTQKKAVPWDGKINWALKESSVFDSEKEEHEACNILSRHHNLSNMWFCQYGLRYIPQSDNNNNTYRTIKIEYLPLFTTVDVLLSKIRGGAIYSARLLNTSPITGHHTALVVFLLQRDALRFLERASKMGFSIHHAKAKVSLVNTPTYPISREMERLIFREGHTRCISMTGMNELLVKKLSLVMQKCFCHYYVESTEDGYEGQICIRFHSIKIATAVYELVRNNPRFRYCRVSFARDPCCQDPEDEGGKGGEDRGVGHH